jgi:hypothetical protein
MDAGFEDAIGFRDLKLRELLGCACSMLHGARSRFCPMCSLRWRWSGAKDVIGIVKLLGFEELLNVSVAFRHTAGIIPN